MAARDDGGMPLRMPAQTDAGGGGRSVTGWVNERAARCTRLADARAAGGQAGEGASVATAKRTRGEILG